MKKIIGVLFLAYSLLPSQAFAKDWSCAQENPWGGGLAAQLKLQQNGDSTFRMLFSRLLLGSVDQPVLRIENLVLSEKAKCVFSGSQLVHCTALDSPDTHLGSMTIPSFLVAHAALESRTSMDASGAVSTFNTVAVTIETNRDDGEFKDLARNRAALRFGTRADSPLCGFLP